jgi:hypothetical protein
VGFIHEACAARADAAFGEGMLGVPIGIGLAQPANVAAANAGKT